LEEVVTRFEKELVVRVLESNYYNLAKTADQLRITRHALRYRMNRLGIETEAGAGGEEAGAATRREPEA
jgi:transcriptional regulator with GAF, ATPase, and Fis domain